MKRALIAAILLNTCFASAGAHARVITVRLPALEVSGHAEAELGLYGNGLCLTSESAKGTTITLDVEKLASNCSSGSHDFRPITSVKILLLVPGYAVSTLDTDTYDSPVWAPRLVKLPVRVVEGWIDPAPKVPIRLSFRYPLLEAMGFFSYYDGDVPDIELGTVTTDSQGHFRLSLPDLAGDPFVQAASGLVNVRFNSPDHPEPREAFDDLSLELRQLYSGSRLVLRRNRDWPHPSLPPDSRLHRLHAEAHSVGCKEEVTK
ncbi:MAG TPA: hypothetical protein VGM86_21215 [Thermoanaerobaculia bacterium]|jgi:hypothetical protein